MSLLACLIFKTFCWFHWGMNNYLLNIGRNTILIGSVGQLHKKKNAQIQQSRHYIMLWESSVHLNDGDFLKSSVSIMVRDVSTRISQRTNSERDIDVFIKTHFFLCRWKNKWRECQTGAIDASRHAENFHIDWLFMRHDLAKHFLKSREFSLCERAGSKIKNDKKRHVSITILPLANFSFSALSIIYLIEELLNIKFSVDGKFQSESGEPISPTLVCNITTRITRTKDHEDKNPGMRSLLQACKTSFPGKILMLIHKSSCKEELIQLTNTQKKTEFKGLKDDMAIQLRLAIEKAQAIETARASRAINSYAIVQPRVATFVTELAE
ncbi:hypothetical protein G9A89_005214 [Geosiphon pyriformis]|nr:hypothetical protein G9A89_005214 [Geosiphon pyriformis]